MHTSTFGTSNKNHSLLPSTSQLIQLQYCIPKVSLILFRHVLKVHNRSNDDSGSAELHILVKARTYVDIKTFAELVNGTLNLRILGVSLLKPRYWFSSQPESDIINGDPGALRG